MYTTLVDCLPLLGKERGNRARQDLALVVNVLEDVLGPLHEVTDLVAR